MYTFCRLVRTLFKNADQNICKSCTRKICNGNLGGCHDFVETTSHKVFSSKEKCILKKFFHSYKKKKKYRIQKKDKNTVFNKTNLQN